MRWTILLLGLSSPVTAAGCWSVSLEGAPGSVIGFETGTVHVNSATDSLVLQVEIAETDEQHRTGLARRSELAESAGMLFLFEEEQPRGRPFWMYRTSLPLSIALLDSQWVIRQIRDMEPCRSRLAILCPRYAAAVPFHAALEVNRGFFTRHGIGVGDRVTLERSR